VSLKNGFPFAFFYFAFWFVCVALGFTDLGFKTHHCTVTKRHCKRRSAITIVSSLAFTQHHQWLRKPDQR